MPSCYCEDYQPKDPSDSMCFECECGHVQDEHARTGFFRRCIFASAEAEG